MKKLKQTNRIIKIKPVVMNVISDKCYQCTFKKDFDFSIYIAHLRLKLFVYDKIIWKVGF